MSDYLWDRTGERDAEVERLETLLGAFAHKPRPLELPAEESLAAAPRTPRLFGFARRTPAPRLFAPAGLAAAAALALVLFGAAAALLLRARSDDGGGRSAAREAAPSQAGTQKGFESKPSEPARGGPESATARHAPESATRVDEVKNGGAVAQAGVSKIKKGAMESLARGSLKRKGLQAAAAAGRERGARVARGGGASDEAFTFEAMRSGGGASALVESTRLATKERLVYALRLTGAKLRDVRQRAQGSDGQDSRPR